MAGRDKWAYGKAYRDGELLYSSASTLTTADPSSDGGCLRKAWYQVVMGIKSPSTKSQLIGTQTHAEIEHYEKTGEKKLGPIAMSGFHMLPEPGPDLGIEKDIGYNEVAHDEAADMEARAAEMVKLGQHEGAETLREMAIIRRLHGAPIRAAGVPIVGFIDLVHARGPNKGGTSIEDTVDPPNTVEVIDWKTTSDPRYIKSAPEVAKTIQMTTYGKWVITRAPQVEHVLDHPQGVCVARIDHPEKSRLHVRSGGSPGWTRGGDWPPSRAVLRHINHVSR